MAIHQAVGMVNDHKDMRVTITVAFVFERINQSQATRKSRQYD